MNHHPDQPTLIIRADASAAMGTGHVMRCLALAQAWQDRGGKVTFVMAETTPAIEARLEAEGMTRSRLGATGGSETDAELTAQLARDEQANWVVADGYQFGAAYQQAILEAGLRLLFLDDCGHAEHYFAEVVLNQNIYADESLYADRERHTRLLLGTKYALLRREFRLWQNTRRVIPSVARRLLVTMGGADPDNVTLKVVGALEGIDVEGVEVAVVVGGGNRNAEVLERAAIDLHSGRPDLCVRIERNVTDMAGLMAWADFAVSAAGSTCGELAFMGMPSLVLVLADNQESVAAGLDAAGAAINLGRASGVTAAAIASELTGLAGAPGRRLAMSQRGQALVDGDGIRRVLQEMWQPQLSLRPAQAADCRLLWEWANDPLTRAASFSSEPIPWQEHVAWFNARLNESRTFFFIGLDGAATPIGQIRFEIDCESATVSVGLAPVSRGRGYGSHLIRLASRQLFGTTATRRIHAYVKPINLPSVNAFTRAGYIRAGMAQVRGQPALHLVQIKESLHDQPV